MTFRLGLTGSIGMGKTTTARFFAERGLPVWNADTAVHRSYAPGGAAVPLIVDLCPEARASDGSIDRAALRAAIATDHKLLTRINAIVHPLVAADRDAFLNQHADAPITVLDIPLLFENGLEVICDGVAVVSVAPDVQRARVLARGTMSEHEFEVILAQQMPDADKRARATWLIDTSTLATAERDVAAILADIHHRIAHA